MFHSTFPKLDIITDYILNYEAAARTSVTSQMMCWCPFPFHSRNLAFERVKYTLVRWSWPDYVGAQPIGLQLICLADRVT